MGYSPVSCGHGDNEDETVTGLRDMLGGQDTEEGPGRGMDGAQAIPKTILQGAPTLFRAEMQRQAGATSEKAQSWPDKQIIPKSGQGATP